LDTKTIERIYSAIFLLLSSEDSLSLDDLANKIPAYSKDKESRRKMWARDQKIISELGYNLKISEDGEYAVEPNHILMKAQSSFKDPLMVIDEKKVQIADLMTILINNRVSVEFIYNTKKRFAQAVQLVVSKIEWYLICVEDQKEKTFKVSKIYDLKIVRIETEPKSTPKAASRNKELIIEEAELFIKTNEDYVKSLALRINTPWEIENKKLVFQNISQKNLGWLLSECYSDVALLKPEINFTGKKNG
jgi:predicted DNA-binding transcriptional regulator YafY